MVASSSEPINHWREYELLVDLYKFYLDLVVKAVAAYFAIVGAILTIVLANVADQPIIVGALAVPLLLSILLGRGAMKSKDLVRELSTGLDKLGDTLAVQVKPHSQVLESTVSGLFIFMLVAMALLVGLFAWLAATR